MLYNRTGVKYTLIDSRAEKPESMFDSFLHGISLKRKEEKKVACSGNTIQDFIKLFPTLKGVRELITEESKHCCEKVYSDYAQLICQVIAESPFISDLGFTEEVDRVASFIISYIQWSLYSQVFPKVPSDEDKAINEKCKEMEHLEPKEFDVKAQNINMPMFRLGIKQLKQAEQEYTVESKINCYTTVHGIIGKGITTITDKIPGADDITPIIVYLIVQSMPQMIASNLK